MKQEEKKLDAAGPLYVALTEYKKQDPRETGPGPLLEISNLARQLKWAPLEIREAVPWKAGLETYLRDGELSQKRRAWMRLSVKQERNVGEEYA